MSVRNRSYDAIWRSPVGVLGVSVKEECLLAIDYLSNRYKPRSTTIPYAKEVLTQLKHYFNDPAFEFDVSLSRQGTDHQQRVWRSLVKIPNGKTISYGKLASRLHSGARAIGNACRHNPVSIIVPCHRVVAANGPGGYGGAVNGVILQRKLWLLEHEGALRAKQE